MAEEAEERLWEMGRLRADSGANPEEAYYSSNTLSYYIDIYMK
jgi:hypothetical protein